jgi:hypothetical protein
MNRLFRVGYLERLPLRTPYPAQAAAIANIMSRLPRGTGLIVDYTGVGRGIYDLLVDYGLSPIGVTQTGGMESHWTGNTVTVPKSTLVSRLLRLFHEDAIRVCGDLKLWPVMRRELLAFNPRVTEAGHETWAAARSEHDDLVTAGCLASWYLQGGDMKSQGFFELCRQAVMGYGEVFAVGVDLGQARDFTAVCVMSRIDNPSQDDVNMPAYIAAAA